ncbi:hypothetical protein cyc_04561 [Cyclospora cayetanensis]|uniref:Pre-mRNA-splicing factor SLU7 n=1 Tax=Cyclospora cayetanensis TaxID=88456 RepID=A0A1D3CX33_9EIME|nr:hypothetical protein cyc_04561 [Cyclospora cayetanensis]
MSSVTSAAFQSREEARRARELEEARKAGTAPAEKDADGKEINPHIPQYISKAPWYLNQDKPGLKHQRFVEEKRASIHTWHRHGVIEEAAAAKKLRFLKGACGNCGSMTHKEKDCTDRPRAKKAKYTHKDLAPDEIIAETPKLTYDAKRDRYGGYTGDDFKWLLHDFDKTSAPVACKDERSRINTRDLRIREDTAKYLLNLDIGSAFYDPKSRSMRDDPFKHLSEAQRGPFRGDNALLQAGEVKATQQLQLFAWEAYKHGQNVHFNAQPTQLEFLFQEHQKKKTELEAKKQSSVIVKYGGVEHLQTDPRILYAQTEAYAEYSRDGRVLRGRERTLTKSKYEEDVHPGNHTSVWGSYYSSALQKWGFACCRQTSFRADCTGRPEDSITLESLELAPPAAEAADSTRESRDAAESGAAGKEEEAEASAGETAEEQSGSAAAICCIPTKHVAAAARVDAAIFEEQGYDTRQRRWRIPPAALP